MTANLTLTYGSLNLTSAPYAIEFGADFGAPQNVTQALAFMLQDGEIELTDRTSNRTIQFNVQIEGASLLAIAQAEAALTAEASKGQNTLSVDPGDSGPATVFETFRAQVTWLRDDNGDMQRLRRYAVTIKAMPAGRSASETVATALAASGTTTTLVDDGSATTGWSATVNGSASTVSTSAGAVFNAVTAVVGAAIVRMTRAGSITTSSTKYLVVDWKAQTAGVTVSPLKAFGDGVALDRVSETVSPTAGYTRTHFYVAAASVASLVLESDSTAATSLNRQLVVDNINRTDIKPSLGSAHQLLRSVTVDGSARTQATLVVEHATSALGDVLAYVWPEDIDGFAGGGYSPPLRQYRVSGGAVTTDSTAASGSWDPLVTSTTTYEIPVAKLPSGNYILMARMLGSAATHSVTWTATTVLNSVDLGPTFTGTQAVLLGGASYTISTLGRVVLPTRSLGLGSAGVVRVTMAATIGTVRLDEVWLFNTTVGQLVSVSCGTAAPTTGGSANRLFIQPATVDTPRPTIFIGTAADGSDAFFPQTLSSWQRPVFTPPRENVFTVTTNALDASVTLRHFPRWELNAAS
jgi:hypothetical protein